MVSDTQITVEIVLIVLWVLYTLWHTSDMLDVAWDYLKIAFIPWIILIVVAMAGTPSILSNMSVFSETLQASLLGSTLVVGFFLTIWLNILAWVDNNYDRAEDSISKTQYFNVGDKITEFYMEQEREEKKKKR